MAERNERPTLNVPKMPNAPDYSLPESVKTKFPVFPEDLFSNYNRNTVKSKNLGGFPNAKAASMLERGLKKKSVSFLGRGNSGVLVIDDGPQIEVSVTEGLHRKDKIYVYTFKDNSGNEFDIPYEESWDFYIKTDPVPFVPRVRRQTRKQRRKQRGGFYPSVYGGVAGAKMLTPLIARQMMRMYEAKTRKHKSKKPLK